MIPPAANAAFAACLEDVLEVYTRPYDARRPLICLEEAGRELVAATRAALPAKPGQPAWQDFGCGRAGACNVFMLSAPPCWASATFSWRERRTRRDFAAVVKTLGAELYPAAEKIVLVLDNLNTHGPASLYAA